MPEEFVGLSPDNVKLIQNKVKTVKYTLSPFPLNVFSSKEKAPKNTYFIHINIDKSTVYGCLYPILEDHIVITALGHLLNSRLISLNIPHSLSFGYNQYPSSYFAHILSSIKIPVSRLYKINMLHSLFKINKESLLTMLEPIVLSSDIMQLIKSILYMPITLYGEEVDFLNDFITPSGYFTTVLLNLYLNQLDIKFNLQFPSYSYARYNEEIIVTTSKNNLLFENSLYGLFDDLNMTGNIISVSPGDDPITSTYGGVFRVCTDGIVQITSKMK